MDNTDTARVPLVWPVGIATMLASGERDRRAEDRRRKNGQAAARFGSKSTLGSILLVELTERAYQEIPSSISIGVYFFYFQLPSRVPPFKLKSADLDLSVLYASETLDIMQLDSKILSR